MADRKRLSFPQPDKGEQFVPRPQKYKKRLSLPQLEEKMRFVPQPYRKRLFMLQPEKKRLFLLQPDKKVLLVPPPNKKWLLEPEPLEPTPPSTQCKCWYKDRDKLPSGYLAKHRNRLLKCPTALDSRQWRFVREGLDDFRMGCPPCDNMIIRGPREGFVPVIAHRVPRPPSQKTQKKLPKGAELLSKLSPAQQARKAFVEQVEASLSRHPLACYSDLKDSLPADLLLKVLEVLDPDRKLEDTWAHCEGTRDRKESPTKLCEKCPDEVNLGPPSRPNRGPPSRPNRGPPSLVNRRFPGQVNLGLPGLVSLEPPGQINPGPRRRVKQGPRSRVKQGPPGQVNPRPPDEVNLGSPDQVILGPPDQVNQGTLDQDNPVPSGQVNLGFPSQVNLGASNEVNPGPPSQVNNGPLSPVNPGPPGQVHQGPPGKVNRGPHGQVNPGPHSGVIPGPLGRVNLGSSGEVNPGPYDELNRGPPGQVNTGCPGEGNPGHPDQVNPGPPDEVKSGLPRQVNSGPPSEVNPGSPNEVTVGAPNEVNMEPPKESLLACINRLFPETKKKKKRKKRKNVVYSKVPTEVHKFCKWVKTFGDMGIDEEYIMKQFEIDYRWTPTQSTGKIKKINQLPLDLIYSRNLDDIEKRRFSLQEDNWERKLVKPHDPYKPKRVKIRYGAWYLNPKTWKKLVNDEPLVDPKVLQEEEYWNYGRHLEPDIIDDLYGPIAFKDFIISKGYEMPGIIEKLFFRKKWTYDSVKTPIDRVMKLLSKAHDDSWEDD